MAAHNLIVAWTDEAIASFQSHPLFERALRQSAADKAHLFAVEPSLHRFALDRGYSFLGIFATCLHFAEGGLTVTALKEMARESKAASPGRIASFVAMMRKIGAIAEAEPGMDRRVHRLVVTEPFIDFMRARLRIDIAALAVLSPIGERGLAAFERATFFPATMRVAAALVRGGISRSQGGVIEFFSERHMGLHVIHDVIGNNEQALQSLPVTISVSSLSKRFGVSRPHVLKLFRDAHAAGLVTWVPQTRSLTLSPTLVERLRYYFAVIFIGTAFNVLIVTAEEQAPAHSDAQAMSARA